MRCRAALLAGAVALAAAAPAAAAPTLTEFPIPTANSMPQEIVQAPDGSLWFTELGVDQIAKVTPSEPPVIEEFDVSGVLTNPLSIAVGPDGNVWFTGTVGGEGGVGRINPANPADVQAYSGFGAAATLGGIATGPDGNLWVTDFQDDVAFRISTAGVKVGGNINLDPANPVIPRGITRGPGNTMWVAGDGGYIVRISGDGATATSFDTPGSSAWDIAAGLDGNLWYTSPNAAIGRITPAGAATEYPLPGGATDPFGLTVGPDAAIWFAQAVGNSIGRSTKEIPPAITSLGGLSPASRPEYIAQGPQYTLWFTEKDGNRIGRITGIDPGIDLPQPPATDTTRPAVETPAARPQALSPGPCPAVGVGRQARPNGSLQLERALDGHAGLRPGPPRAPRRRALCQAHTAQPHAQALHALRVGQAEADLLRPGAGAERIRFAGRLTRRTSLRPGAHRLTLRARDAAGNVSRPVRARFRLLAPERKAR